MGTENFLKFAPVLSLLALCALPFFAQAETVILGDVDRDAKISIADALKTAKFVVNDPPPDFNVAASDVTGDQTTDIVDALSIAQFSVGNLKDFPGNIRYRQFKKLLTEGKEKWEKMQVTQYAYTYTRHCFCINGGIPFIIRVMDGEIVSAEKKNENDTGYEHPEEHASVYPTIEKLFKIVEQAIAEKRRIMDLSFDPVYGYPAVVGIDNIPVAIDDEITHLAADFHPLKAIVMSNRPREELEKDDFSLRAATVTGDVLSLDLLYSGGCAEHSYILYAQEGFMESYPVQVNVYLYHDDGGDMCDAIIADTPAFDLRPLAEYYLEVYGSKDPIILNIHDYYRKTVSKVLKVTYNPL